MASRLLIDENGNVNHGKMYGGTSFDRKDESEEDEESSDSVEEPEKAPSKAQDIPKKSIDNTLELQKRIEKLEEIVEMLRQRIDEMKEIPKSEMEKTAKYKLYLDEEICGELEVGNEAIFDLRLSKKGNVKICKMGDDGSQRLPVGSKISLEIDKENVEGLFFEEKNHIYFSMPTLKKYPITLKFAI